MTKLSISRVFAAALFIAGGMATEAQADENLASLGRLATPGETEPPAADSRWGTVPGDKISLVNVAPALLAYFNNGPVFGLPGTNTGSLLSRTQLTGDWGGTRTEWARHGVFLDLYTTSAYQDTNAGGLKQNEIFVQNVQLSLNIDTARAGWWSGGILHFTAQGRYGADAADSFTGGATVPQYTALVYPGPTLSDKTYLTEYYLAQALSRQFSVILGRISNIFIPDQTLMADSYKYYFANFNFNKNPMTPNFYNPTSLAALVAWAPSPKFALAGGVLDPYSEANTLAHDAFKHVNLYTMTISNYRLYGLPGQFSPAFNWSNKPKTDLDQPYGSLEPAQIPQAIGGLVGGPTTGLPLQTYEPSWFAIANFSQYLYVRDEDAEIPGKLRSGQVINGIGLIARIGYAPPRTNTVTRDASIALFAHGLLGERRYDSFGAGFYVNAISDRLGSAIASLSEGTITTHDERGMEVFYDFALTPAARIIVSYQHIWNPLTAEVAFGHQSTDVFLARLALTF